MITAHPRYSVLATLVDSLIAKVRLAQASYYTVNRSYFQGIRVPGTELDGNSDVVVNWGTKPTDQATAWKDFDATTFKSSVKIPFNISVNVYQGPSGWGWILCIELWIAGLGPDNYSNDGSHWRYNHHEGPNPAGILDEWYIEPDAR